MSSLREEYESQHCWGMVVSIDLYDCHPSYLKDQKKIRELINKLVAEIKMTAFGEPLIERFAESYLEGYSAMQFIKTSSITMHFDEVKNRAFIDIFSCRFFEPEVAENFCKKFLEAKSARRHHWFRD